MAVRRRRLRWLGAVLALGLATAVGTSYAVKGGDEQPDHTTVAATRADVEETYSTTGTVDAAQRADLGFGTGGTVAKVEVEQGEEVESGDVLAVLDTTELDATVTEAEAAYARAVAQLELDKEGQAATVSAASGNAAPDTVDSREPSASRSGARTSSSATSPSPSPGPTIDLSGLEDQQHAVIDAQTAASEALATARDALAAQTQACQEAFRAQAAPEAVPGDGTAEAPVAPTPDPADEACTQALADVQDKQAVAERAQAALADALTALSATLTQAIAALEQAVQEQPDPEPTPPPAKPEEPVKPRPQDQPRAQQQPAPTPTAATAAQLAADQAAIVQAEADLVTARQAREQATLRATRDGKIATLDIEVGDRAEAGSPVAVIVGGTAATVSLQVPETKLGALQVGQLVRVSPPGSTEIAEGQVQAVGLVVDSNAGSASYGVTVSVEDPAIPLPTGSQAQVDVVLATAADAVTVPISAVTVTGDQATVRVWDGTALVSRPVTLGVVGTRRVQVLDGLEVGQRVVLADKGRSIDGASSEINERGGFMRPGGPGQGGIGPRLEVRR